MVGAVELATGDETLCFITSDAQLLHFGAAACARRAAPAAAWPASGSPPASRWPSSARSTRPTPVVVTVVRLVDRAAGHRAGAVKVTPFAEYPAKGRATGGVRCHRFLKGEDALVLAWAGAGPGPGRGGQRRPGRPARGRRPPRRLRHARQLSRSPRSPGPSRRAWAEVAGGPEDARRVAG